MSRAALALLCLLPLTAQAAEIGGVSHAPPEFDPAKGEQAAIRFSLSAPARVALEIYDLRDLLVRRIAATPEELAAGDHQLAWDGRDEHGAVVQLD